MSTRYPLLSQAPAAAVASLALLNFGFGHGTANAITVPPGARR